MDQQTENRILRELTEWGCDVPGAMKRVLNNSSFYCQLLSTVLQESTFDTLGTAIQEQKTQEAFELAHTLKGVLGNMGLTPMYEVCCAIVEPLRAGKPAGTDAHYKTLLRQRDRLQSIVNGTHSD